MLWRFRAVQDAVGPLVEVVEVEPVQALKVLVQTQVTVAFVLRLFLQRSLDQEEVARTQVLRQRIGERLWVPVEVTHIGQSFEAAWELGAEELGRLPALERRERLVDTRTAWKQYPASPPPTAGEVAALDREMLADVVAAQSAALEERVDVHIAKTYLDPLKLTPDNDALPSL